MPAKQEIIEIIENEVIGRNDIAFTHSIFAQCIMVPKIRLLSRYPS